MTKEIQPDDSASDLTEPGLPKRKALVVYGSIVVLITIMLGMISITNLNAYIPGILVIALQLLTFMAFGVLHSYLTNRYVPVVGKSGANNRAVFSGLIFLIVCLALVVMYAIRNTNMVRMAITSGCAFLLPVIIIEAWRAYTRFPEKEYPVWYNSDGVMDTRTTIFLNSVPIRLRLAMKYFDIEAETFELTVPGHTPFGKFFNQFIIEQNKSNPSNIECFDLEKKPFGWQFYTMQLWGLYKQIIDPELSLRENKIGDHSIITAKRKRVFSAPSEENQAQAELKAFPLVKSNKSIKTHEAEK